MCYHSVAKWYFAKQSFCYSKKSKICYSKKANLLFLLSKKANLLFALDLQEQKSIFAFLHFRYAESKKVKFAIATKENVFLLNKQANKANVAL